MSLRVDVGHIVPSIVVPTVDQHCMQSVADGTGVSYLQELVQIKLLRKLIPANYKCGHVTYASTCMHTHTHAHTHQIYIYIFSNQ